MADFLHQFLIIPHFVYCADMPKYCILITDKELAKCRNFYIDNTRTRR